MIGFKDINHLMLQFVSKETLLTSSTCYRLSPVNMEVEDHHIFARAMEREIPASFAYSFKNCLISNRVILSKRRVFFNLTESYQKFSKRDRLVWWLNLLQILIKKVYIIDQGIWVYRLGCGGYFHWMTEALPQLLALGKKVQGRQVLIPQFYQDKPYIGNSLRFLGVEPVYLEDDVAYRVNDLIVPDLLAPSGNYNESTIQRLRTRMTQKFNGNEPNRLIYISRKKRNKRIILNEEEVIQTIDKFGFEIIYFEDYSFEEQIKIASECNIIVSIHGAGLTNMLFMKAGGGVLEIRRRGDSHNNCYFSLASALRLAYYYQFCEGDHQDTHIANLNVDVALLENNIAKMVVPA